MDVLLLFDYLPQNLRNIAYRMPEEFRRCGEEIRLRSNRPMVAYMNGKSYKVSADGRLSQSEGFIITKEMLDLCFDSFTKMSPYAFANELSEGYITVEGGHRIGLCGRRTGSGVREITSVNMRIARQIKGCADDIYEKLLPFENTLVISPPGTGKTTLLRDIARRLSDDGAKVAISDERCEIGASFRGELQMDVGENTDVLSGFPLYDATRMLLRVMSPEVIVTDELGSEKDYSAICEMMKSGVKVLASAHGSTKQDVKMRLGLMAEFFKRFVIIEKTGGVRSVIVDS